MPAKWQFQHALFFLLTLILLAIAACASQSSVSLKEAIVGKWVNAEGYSIEFYADGTGFVPGVEGPVPIPATDFSYSVTDETHIRITAGDLAGTVVEIKMEGDQMTWVNEEANIAFVYTRSK